MYLHKLGGSWLKHPFLRNSFLLEDQNDIKRILQAGIKEAWIDESKGLAREKRPASKELQVEEIETEILPEDPVVEEPAGSMEEEIQRARKFCNEAKEQVKEMFSEVRMGKSIDSEKIIPMVGEIETLVQRNASTILSVARLKTHDDYTYMHSVAVCALMMSLAHHLDLDEEQTRLAGIGGLMHDLGKALMPMDILQKPGKLTDAEFATIKKHPQTGAAVLQKNGAEPEVVDIALHHHEKIDGTGYPDGLAGDDISLLARMGAICDVYDAVTSERPYKNAWDPSAAIQSMAKWEGHFDKKMFAIFVKSVGIYPVGSLVKLSNKRLAVVVEPGIDSLLKPTVKSFFSITSKAAIAVEVIDLAAQSCKVTIEGPENPEKWGFKSLERFWT
jgi:putative nucleotidyltransferase with HDIG domain